MATFSKHKMKEKKKERKKRKETILHEKDAFDWMVPQKHLKRIGTWTLQEAQEN